MSLRRFSQLDVFTDSALLGNPLAVVHEAEGLADERLAAFARWTNLSETTFLLPPSLAMPASMRSGATVTKLSRSVSGRAAVQ